MEPQPGSIDGEWDFTGSNTQYLTHKLHPYLAAMIPQIPEKLLSIYIKDERTRILDPFVGGGAVIVEAHLRNLDATGFDINPLSVIIAKAKTTPIPIEFLDKARLLFDKIYPKVDLELPVFSKNSRIEYWFKPYMFESLAKIRSTIREVVYEFNAYQPEIENLFKCIFSKTVRDVSLTYRNEIRLRKLQGKDLEAFSPEVFHEFQKRMVESFDCVGNLNPRNRLPKVFQGDAKNIPLEDKSFDLVITSPPYGDLRNSIPYAQFSKNMLYWLGLGDQAVAQIREGALGQKNKSKKAPEVPTLRSALSNMDDLESKVRAHSFYFDYWKALEEISRVTSERIIIVIGHRMLNGQKIDNAAITTEMMFKVGWKLESLFSRNIKGKRIHRKMCVGNNGNGGTVDTESILVYVPQK
jgi:DNA modification methylase